MSETDCYTHEMVDVEKTRIIKNEKGEDIEEKYIEQENKEKFYGRFKTLQADEVTKLPYAVCKVLVTKVDKLEEENITLHTQNNYLLGKIKLLFEELKTMNEKIDKLEHHLNTDLFDNTSINKNDEIPDKFSITG